MSRRNRRPTAEDERGGFTGAVRFARPGDSAVKTLREGDIVVVELPDLDRAQAEALVERKVRAVLNVAPSSTGRFPNLGPQVLAEAGITLVDRVGAGIWTRVRNGDTVRVEDGRIFKDEVLVGQGRPVDDAAAAEQLGAAERDLATRLGSLTANASDHLERERALLLEGARVPRLGKKVRGRPVVVVSRTYGWEDDLALVRRWARDHGAVLVGVGDAADALLDAKLTPDVVVGRLDDLSDRALRCGAEVVVVSPTGQGTGHERLEKARVDAVPFVATGSATDLAILLADSNEAEVIVEVGGPRGLVEFLERGPADVASAFVTRLRAGSRLVDARAVRYFVGHSLPAWPVVLAVLAGLVAVAVAVATTPTGEGWVESLGDALSDLRSWIEGLL